MLNISAILLSLLSLGVRMSVVCAVVDLYLKIYIYKIKDGEREREGEREGGRER